MELVPDIFRRIVLDLLHSQEQPIKHLTVKEFLWGYQDPLLRTLHKEFPNIVPDDQVSVFNASVIQHKFFLIFFHQISIHDKFRRLLFFFS
jgi:hypothetical protein